MGAGRLSFNPKVMISRHQSSESEHIKNSQKLNQKLKISKKHFKNQLKLKESRSSSACGRLPGQKKRFSLCSDFEDWWYWNHPLILSSKTHVCQNNNKYFNFYNHSHVLSEPIRKIFILIFQGAGHCDSGLATF